MNVTNQQPKTLYSFYNYQNYEHNAEYWARNGTKPFRYRQGFGMYGAKISEKIYSTDEILEIIKCGCVDVFEYDNFILFNTYSSCDMV
ncbi:hypothetical protein LP092_14970 (plasmid) [Moraxella bovis]|uniref:Uncharacterized protein n=1 Tax=Moraxella bovis TaxID=476 RepID=A0ABY6MBD8_MORBO|nr:hypothetical protein [Moraxella bovis]UZA04778.1 hypothetical protein LP092_14970 [Moraxella bovis]